MPLALLHSLAPLLIALALVFQSPQARASFDYQAESEAFYRLDPERRAVLQYGLVWTGDYNGLVDGQFGPATYNGIKEFRRREGWSETGSVDERLILLILERARERFERVGFQIITDPAAGVSFGLPTRFVSGSQPTRRGSHYYDADEKFVVDTIRIPASEEGFWSVYDRLRQEKPRRTVSYAVFKGEQFIIAGDDGGKRFYIRMFDLGGDYRGFAVAWNEQSYGRIDHIVVAMANTLSQATENTPEPEKIAPPTEGGTATGSGSGFFLGGDGTIITNHHVIAGCGGLMVAGYGPAELVQVNAATDIAVLRVSLPAGAEPPAQACLRDHDGQLGETVLVIGYPLGTILNNAVTVTYGNLSSLAGLGGDTNNFSFTAPIQPGNSGGSILDEQGHVVGVTVAKLSDTEALEKGGFVPQNLNFGIRVSTLRNTLQRMSVEGGQQCSVAEHSREQMIDRATRFTVQVICLSQPTDTPMAQRLRHIWEQTTATVAD